MNIKESLVDENYIRINKCWEEFVTTGRVSKQGPLRKVILDSWKRSAAYGLDPYACQRVFVDCDLLVDKNKQLIEAAEPHMELIHSLVVGSGFVVVLIDKDGYVLKRIGDSDVIDKANRNYLSPGENRSETHTGTNAIALALTIGKPIQIFGPEHYSHTFHNWTCSCAPIRNSTGKIIGALNLSGHYSLLHKHTLGLVVSAVKAIERELNLVEAHREVLDANRYLESVIDSVTDGLLAVEPDGRIIKTNTRVRALLGERINNLEDLFDPRSNLYKMIKSGKGFSEIEYYFKNSKSYCLVSAKAITGTKNQTIGFLIMIKEKEKVHNLVNRIVGSTATFSFSDIIGNSILIKECINLAETAAQTECKVLLEGESGTGKELFAQGIHNYSSRSSGPFIAVNCSAIPRELVESELFGYEEGAFSGANKKGKPGRFELAEGGTLFLDEASTISLDMQAKLLRVIQENRTMRLGGINTLSLNVRLIIATNKDLTKLIEEGSFREDLYYRLSVFTLNIPPLRDRKEDIPLLVNHFCLMHAAAIGKNQIDVSPEVMKSLQAYHWPGNVRELQNVIERAVILSKGSLHSNDCLPDTIFSSPRTGRSSVDELERVKENAITEALEKTNGNITRAAKLLGISRNTIYNKTRRKNS